MWPRYRLCRLKAGRNLRRDHRHRAKPEKSGAGPISVMPVVEVISVVIPAADQKTQQTQPNNKAQQPKPKKRDPGPAHALPVPHWMLQSVVRWLPASRRQLYLTVRLNYRYGSNRSPDPPIRNSPDLHNAGGLSCCFCKATRAQKTEAKPTGIVQILKIPYRWARRPV